MVLDTDRDGTADEFDLDDDNDGLPDDIELANGLDPLSLDDASSDKDGDGLTNLEEHQLGTDISDPDTDGDGSADGDEVLAGRDHFLKAQFVKRMHL